MPSWAKQEIPNQFLISDPTSCQPGFNLKRSDWTILNQYHTISVLLLCMYGHKRWPTVCAYCQRMSCDEIPWWASGASLRKRRLNHMAPQAQHTLEVPSCVAFLTHYSCTDELSTLCRSESCRLWTVANVMCQGTSWWTPVLVGPWEQWASIDSVSAHLWNWSRCIQSFHLQATDCKCMLLSLILYR